MDCGKCGNRKMTKRRAGVFYCQHCGMENTPGPSHNWQGPPRPDPSGQPYVFSKRAPPIQCVFSQRDRA